jgi:gas vesicle protein
MELEQLPDKLTHELPGKLTHAVEGLRDRAAGAVSADSGSLFRELHKVENRLGDRIDDVEDSLSSKLSALVSAEARTSWPRRLFWLLIGAGIGAGAAYLADPDRGKSRRTQFSDQAAARAREVSEDLQNKAKMAADRAKGEAIEAAKDALPEDVPDDPKLLEQRIKSEVFGHRDDVQDVVLRVDAPGTVAVKGTVPNSESERDLIAKVAEVEGVIDVRSELSVRSA